MNRSPTLLLTLLLAGAALAGCTGGDEGAPTPTPDVTPTVATPTPTLTTPTPATPTPPVNETPALGNDTYALATAGIPAQAEVGKPFNYTLYVNGTFEATSNHIGAHFRNTTEGALSASAMGACSHIGTNETLPGEFNLTCTLDTPGTHYVYGHVRITENGETYNYWAEPRAVKVRNYTINLTGVPSTAQASSQNFTFTMAIQGTENVTSDHIGAHFWNATTSAPTAANAAGACSHVAGAAIDTFTVTCQIAHAGVTPGTYYLRGHLRITEGGSQVNFWSSEHEVTVLGSLL